MRTASFCSNLFFRWINLSVYPRRYQTIFGLNAEHQHSTALFSSLFASLDEDNIIFGALLGLIHGCSLLNELQAMMCL